MSDAVRLVNVWDWNLFKPWQNRGWATRIEVMPAVEERAACKLAVRFRDEYCIWLNLRMMNDEYSVLTMAKL